MGRTSKDLNPRSFLVQLALPAQYLTEMLSPLPVRQQSQRYPCRTSLQQPRRAAVMANSETFAVLFTFYLVGQ